MISIHRRGGNNHPVTFGVWQDKLGWLGYFDTRKEANAFIKQIEAMRQAVE